MVTAEMQVASELLHYALRLYYDGGSYLAHLHKAGAAEKIFGTDVTRNRRGKFFEELANSRSARFPSRRRWVTQTGGH